MTSDAAPLILSVFSSFEVGGPQVRFATLANSFGRAFRHAIVAMDGKLGCARRLSPDLDVTYPELDIRKGRTLANAWRFRHALATLRPALLVTSNWGSIEWVLANALPLVPHIHAEDGFGPEERSAQLRRRVLLRSALLRRHTVVMPSRTLWRIAHEVWRLPEQRLRYIPNGIDLARFAQGPRLSLPGEGPVIGTVAALRAEKNIPRLLRAFAILSRSMAARLVIVGDGPESPRLRALAVELGLGGRVAFPGHHEDPAAFYRGFDLFALSSDTEQMPLSVLEAMAAGLAVVATEVGDVRDMLSPENLPFLAPQDDAALADRMLRLLADAPLRSAIGAANRARAARDYDQAAMIRAWRHLFDALLPAETR